MSMNLMLLQKTRVDVYENLCYAGLALHSSKSGQTSARSAYFKKGIFIKLVRDIEHR